MTETLIVKYSSVLYSFKFLTSLPKFRDIKNNISQHPRQCKTVSFKNLINKTRSNK
jgi:hypothetical protein